MPPLRLGHPHGYLHGIRVKGIYRGYKGLITGEIEDFETQHVSNIIQRGGTILKTSTLPRVPHARGRAQAYETMRAHGDRCPRCHRR